MRWISRGLLVVLSPLIFACGGEDVPFGVQLFHRPMTRSDRLLAVALRSDVFLSEGPARYLGIVGRKRYWAVRYSDQVCLVDLPRAPRHRIGPGEGCEPLTALRHGPLVSASDSGRGTELIGLIRDGYASVRIEGIREPVPIHANVFHATTRVRHPHLTASGPHVPDITI